VHPKQLESDLLGFVREVYPDMSIRVEPWQKDPSRLAIYFIEAKFAALYPMQRYHYLSHLIPSDYFEKHLSHTAWFELAPGERPEDIRYPDDELIEEISPNVMKCVEKAGLFDALDDAFCPADASAKPVECQGDFRTAREILLARGFSETELFDVFHVLMARGGFCDCEILYNAAPESR
jgi:hypothetical protein